MRELKKYIETQGRGARRCYAAAWSVVVFCLTLALLPASAFAQPDPMQGQTAPAEVGEYKFDTDGVGSVGSILAAVLATAGHSIQSATLDFFEEGFASSMGALAYILSAIAAILTIALGGNYKFGLWFLVGPWVFYWMLLPRMPSAGVRWQVGGKDYDQMIVLSAAQGVTPITSADIAEGRIRPGQEVGKVSWFFLWWDDFTSDVVNAFVSTLRLDVKQIDLSFINRTQRYQQLMSASIQSPALVAYMRLMMGKECGQFFGVMKDVYSAEARLNSSEEIRNEFLRSVMNSDVLWGKVQAENPIILDALQNGLIYPLSEADTKKGEEPFKIGGRVVGFIKPDAKPLANDTAGRAYLQSRVTFSCPELWMMGVRALRDESENLLNLVVNESIPPDLSLEQQKLFRAQAYKDLHDKVKNSCTMHYEKLCNQDSVEAKKKCEKERKDFEKKAQEEQLREFSNSTGKGYMNCLDANQQQIVLLNEIAVRLLFNHLKSAGPSVTITERELNIPKPWYARNDQTAHDARESAAGFEYEGKGIYLSAVLAMPYIQGLGLYFLALAYPFACLLLVVPGRYHTFLQWMAIYFWLKAWDIGFAVIQLLDGLLYNLLPHGPPMLPSMANDPFEAIKTVLEVDPSYSVNTYFNIMGTLVGSVPLITGLLIKQGGGGIANALRHGFQNFSGRIGFAMLQYQTAARNMDLVEGIMRGERKAFLRARFDAVMDMEVMAPLLGHTSAQILQERLKKAKSANQLEGILRGAERDILASDASKDRLKGMWSAKLKSNLQTAVYNESMQVHNLRVAHDTIINWYSNHDFIATHPYQRHIDYMKNAYYVRLGGQKGLIGGAVNSALKLPDKLIDGAVKMIGGGRN